MEFQAFLRWSSNYFDSSYPPSIEKSNKRKLAMESFRTYTNSRVNIHKITRHLILPHRTLGGGGGMTSMGLSGFSNSALAFSICALIELVGGRTALEAEISERGGGGGTMKGFAEKEEDEEASGEMSQGSKGVGGVSRGGGDAAEEE